MAPSPDKANGKASPAKASPSKPSPAKRSPTKESPKKPESPKKAKPSPKKAKASPKKRETSPAKGRKSTGDKNGEVKTASGRVVKRELLTIDDEDKDVEVQPGKGKALGKITKIGTCRDGQAVNQIFRLAFAMNMKDVSLKRKRLAEFSGFPWVGTKEEEKKSEALEERVRGWSKSTTYSVFSALGLDAVKDQSENASTLIDFLRKPSDSFVSSSPKKSSAKKSPSKKSPTKKSSKKSTGKAKDGDKPKRAPTPFFVFSGRHRQDIMAKLAKEKFEGNKVAECGRRLGEMWRALSSKDKEWKECHEEAAQAKEELEKKKGSGKKDSAKKVAAKRTRSPKKDSPKKKGKKEKDEESEEGEMPDDAELKEKTLELLRDWSDSTSVSVKDIRLNLQEHFKVNLKDKRDEIRQWVKEATEEDDEEEGDKDEKAEEKADGEEEKPAEEMPVDE